MEPLDEKIVMQVIEEILNSEHFGELEELDTVLAMGILDIVEDGIRLYHAKSVKKFFKEMDTHYLSKL
tara:strand:- start:207 stop:410 length:204 start_codon:yes stop_codon:yes gene_type:complete